MTQRGRFKDEGGYRWTTDQLEDVEHVVDNFTYDMSRFTGDMIVRFVADLGSQSGYPVWGQRVSGRLLKIRKHIDNDSTRNRNKRRYTIAHEAGHQLAADRIGSSERTQLEAKMFPNGPYGNTWNGSVPYKWKPSEVFAHQFAHLYKGASASWGGVLTGNNTFYERHFNSPFDDEIALINSFTGAGIEEPDPPDPILPVIVWVPAKDQARRRHADGTTKQASGKERHLPMGRIPIGSTNWIYDALLKFTAVWDDEIDTITAANLKLSVIGEPGGTSHIIGSGDKSFLQAKRVMTDWTEGSNDEGEWTNGDYAPAPTLGSNVTSLGAVGAVVTGTRIPFPVEPFIRQWAPARIKVAGLGEGKNEPNHGFALFMSRTDTIQAATEFGSSETDTTDYIPELRIEYIPVSSNPVCEPIGPAGAINTNIFNFEGEFNLPFGTDELGKVELEVRLAGGATIWHPAERLVNANEESLGIFSTYSLAQGAPAWVTGQAYEWRARIRSKRDGKLSAWTDWLGFSITNIAPTVSATSLGSKATLDGVYFGGPYTGPAQVPTGVGTPGGFARMSLWWPYWKGQTQAQVTTAANQMVAQNMRAVLLMGIDWNAPHWELPADVSAKLDIFIAKGITPYLALWLKQLGTLPDGFNEVTQSVAAWNAGNGKWGGVVVDAEAAWKDFQSANPAQAATNMTTWTNAMRAVMGSKVLAYSSYGATEFHQSMNYPLWNSKFDLFFPQIYFEHDADNVVPGGVDHILNRAFNDIEDMGLTKPYIPVMNAYSSAAPFNSRRYYIDRVLATKGAITIYRQLIGNSQTRTYLGTLPRDPPATPQVLRVVGLRVQLRPEAEGNPAWSDDIGLLWDTGEQPLTADEHNNLRVKRSYKGQRLEAGTYTYRVQVQDSLGAWSLWDYATVTLTAPYQPDTGAIDYLSQYRQQSKVRIRIFDMDANRGPGEVKAIIYDAQHIGASTVANDVGEFYFTIPTMHPQASEIEPLRRHYALEFYRGGIWKPLFEGVITDMDADEDEVVFYGLDYLGLLSKNTETAFFDKDRPEQHIEDGGSKYFEKTISFVIKDQLKRSHDETDSPLGFIHVEAHADHVLMEQITSEVTINVAFRERLSLILGLIQSAKQGTGARSRLWVEHEADGTFQWRYKNNAGTERDNLRLKYGELVQGFRLVLLGDWAAKVYGVGRITNETKPRFKSALAPGIATSTWGNITLPAVWNDLLDENDLQRRVKQLAMEMGKFGKSVALGLRVSGIEVFDGWNLLDNIPIEIKRGAVDTTRYGSGYWTIQGVEYRLEPDGHDELTLAIKPREDSTPPDPDLIPSLPISGAGDWSETVGANLTLTSMTMLRNDGTIAAVVNATWDALGDDNLDLYVVEVQHTDIGLGEEPDFHDAIQVTTPNTEVEFEDMLPGEDYAVRVGAYDQMGNFSGYSAYEVITAATDDTVPPVPVGLTVLPAIRALVVSWQPVGVADLAFYEIAYRLTGSGAEFTTIQANVTTGNIAGLLQTDPPAALLTYDVKVRSVDTSNNRSAYSAVVIGTPTQVQSDHIAVGSITTQHIDTVGLDASVITTGELIIGGEGTYPVLVVKNALGQEISRTDITGMIWKDPGNLDRQMRFLDGVLEFSDNNGLTWDTAINADGVVADAILIGGMPGGQNLMPNSSFELAAFASTSEHEWTSAADWGTTIGTDVNITKSTDTLNLTTVT